MALDTKILTFTASTSLGNQDLTGTTFTPKVAIIWYSVVTNTVDTFNEHYSIGFAATDGTNSRCSYTASEDAQGSSDTVHIDRNDCVIFTYGTALNGSSSVQDSKAAFVEWLANGMRINWSDAPANEFKIHVLFLGGADLTNVAVGSYSGTTGTQNVTVGFRPDLVINFATAVASHNAATTAAQMNIGAATGASDQWCQAVCSEQARNTMDTWQYLSHESFGDKLTNTTGALGDQFTFAGTTATQFTITHDEGSINLQNNYIALKGGQYSVGNAMEPESTGNQTVTTDTNVNAVMVFGIDTGEGGGSASRAGNMFTIGAGTSSSEMATLVVADLTGVGDSANTSRYETDSIYLNITPNATATSSTIDDEASLDSVSSSGFVLAWSNVGQVLPFRYITFGSIPPQQYSWSMTEAVSISSNLSRIKTAPRAAADTITNSDSITKLRIVPKTLADSVSNSDSIVKLGSYFRSITDSVSNSEFIAKLRSVVRTISE